MNLDWSDRSRGPVILPKLFKLYDDDDDDDDIWLVEE